MISKIARTAFVTATIALTFVGSASAKIRIAWQTGDVQTILQYADGAGLFREAGLEYSLHAFPSGPAILPALAAKEVEMTKPVFPTGICSYPAELAEYYESLLMSRARYVFF